MICSLSMTPLHAVITHPIYIRIIYSKGLIKLEQNKNIVKFRKQTCSGLNIKRLQKIAQDRDYSE